MDSETTIPLSVVLDILDEVQKRYAPKTGATGAVYSEATQAIQEAGRRLRQAAGERGS